MTLKRGFTGSNDHAVIGRGEINTGTKFFGDGAEDSLEVFAPADDGQPAFAGDDQFSF